MTQTLDRREFSLRAALALLSGATITIAGCGGDSSSTSGPSGNPNPTPSLNPGDRAGSISLNHGHTAVVTAAQITAAGAVILDIRGQGDHTHTVSLSAAQVTTIGTGGRVTMNSTTEDAHNHSVTFN